MAEEKRLQSACLECPPEDRDYDSEKCISCTKKTDRLLEIGGLSPRNIPNSGSTEPPSAKDVEEARRTIKNICRRTGIDYEREMMAGVQDKNITDVRKHVIMVLHRIYKMSDGAVAELLNVTPQYINIIVAGGNGDVNGTMIQFFGEDTDVKNQDEVISDELISNGYLVMIDFSNYPELYKSISRLASIDMRPKRLQILYMLQSFIDREMKIE